MVKHCFKITFIYSDGSSEYCGAMNLNSIPKIGDVILNYPVYGGIWVASEVNEDDMTILVKRKNKKEN